MLKFSIPKLDIDTNKGYNFQACMELFFSEIDKPEDFRRDNIPYYIGSDLPSVDGSVKSCNQATLCMIDNSHVKLDTVGNMVDSFLLADYSTHYYIGLDKIDDTKYCVVQLDKTEFKQLLIPYIFQSVSSPKSNKGKLSLKLDLRSKKRQFELWENGR